MPSLKNIGSLQYYDLYLIAKEVCFLQKPPDWFDDRVNITVYNLFPDSNSKYTELLNSKNPDIKLIGKILKKYWESYKNKKLKKYIKNNFENHKSSLPNFLSDASSVLYNSPTSKSSSVTSLTKSSSSSLPSSSKSSSLLNTNINTNSVSPTSSANCDIILKGERPNMFNRSARKKYDECKKRIEKKIKSRAQSGTDVMKKLKQNYDVLMNKHLKLQKDKLKVTKENIELNEKNLKLSEKILELQKFIMEKK